MPRVNSGGQALPGRRTRRGPGKAVWVGAEASVSQSGVPRGQGRCEVSRDVAAGPPRAPTLQPSTLPGRSKGRPAPARLLGLLLLTQGHPNVLCGM